MLKRVSRPYSCNRLNGSSCIQAQDIATVRGRAKAALLGAFVADAACMGLHW